MNGNPQLNPQLQLPPDVAQAMNAQAQLLAARLNIAAAVLVKLAGIDYAQALHLAQERAEYLDDELKFSLHPGCVADSALAYADNLLGMATGQIPRPGPPPANTQGASAPDD